MDKMSGLSLDLEKENIDKLKELFPAAVEEGKIDFDMLRSLLGDEVDDSREKYQFTWNGKAKAIKLAQTPSSATLRPCNNEKKSKNWNNTENLYIEGDNLEVLKQLQKTYYGKIRMIYIDPPYNTGTDFVYHDNFEDSLKNYKEVTNQKSSKIESSGKIHTKWLNMIYPRLILAKNLLSDDGVIFISIDDNEQSNLKKMCDEIFGEVNFVGCAGRITKKSNNKGDFWAPNFDYILTYVKNIECAKTFLGDANTEAYNLVDDEGPRAGEKYQLVRLYMSSLQNRNPEQRFWITCPDGSKIIPPGTTFPPERPNLGDGIWRWTKSTYEDNIDKIVIKKVKSSNLINENGEPAEWNVFTKTYLNDVLEKASAKPNSFIENHINQIASHELNKLNIPFDYAKPTSLIKYLMKIAQIQSGDIILDFFSGSASTADAVIQFNAEFKCCAKYIMIQLPELISEKDPAYKAGYKNICEIGEERIRRAGEQIKVEWEKEHPSDTLFSNEEEFTTDIGFKVFKLDSSNVNEWDSSLEIEEKELAERLGEVFKTDRSKEDILYEIMLKYGVFDRQVEEIDVNGKTMYRVGKRYMIVCLEDSIDSSDIKAIGELSPKTVIFKESGFIDDNAKLNAVYNLEKAGVEDIKCI